jgi:anti-sigma factor RsiW
VRTAIWTRIAKRREHRWSWPRISAYIDGELARAERSRLERHADDCEECGPMLRSLRWLVGALRTLGAPPEASVVPSVLQRLRAEPWR